MSGRVTGLIGSVGAGVDSAAGGRLPPRVLAIAVRRGYFCPFPFEHLPLKSSKSRVQTKAPP